MSLIVVSSERFAEHQTPPGHPERPERADVMDVVADDGDDEAARSWRRARRRASSSPVSTTPDYLKRIAETAGRAVALDPDTYTSPETYEIARLAAGAAVDAVERVMSGTQHSRPGAGSAARPPRRAQPRDGLLLLQQRRRRRRRTRRRSAPARSPSSTTTSTTATARSTSSSAIRSVLYRLDPPVSVLPGHRRRRLRSATGDGAGLHGEPAARGRRDRRRLRIGVRRSGRSGRCAQFQPDLILVSAGFDAHERDPLGGMRLTTGAFAAMTMACA